MSQHRIAVTPWEVEAERRREVVKADFQDSARSRRGGLGVRAGATLGIVDRLTSWVAASPSRSRDEAADQVGRSDPCRPATGALKPGC
jgi:hypothetical protein